jgi:hypothetical protein
MMSVLGASTGPRCGWCSITQADPLVVTVTEDHVSPDLCHSCTDAWDDGCRKYIDKVRRAVRR